MRTWQIQEAQDDFFLMVRNAEEAPQEIIHQGRSVAVLLSRADYDQLTGTSQSLVEFMRRPFLNELSALVADRDVSLTREFEL